MFRKFLEIRAKLNNKILSYKERKNFVGCRCFVEETTTSFLVEKRKITRLLGWRLVGIATRMLYRLGTRRP
jgi:hypothetical protein